MVPAFLFLFSIIYAEVDELTAAYQAIEKRRINSFEFRSPYTGEDLSIPNWDIGGDTIINNEKYIRLTDDAQSQTGSLWSNIVSILISL